MNTADLPHLWICKFQFHLFMEELLW